MSETNTSLYFLGAGLGGTIFASTSASGMWLLENKKPNAKTLGRDFVLGAIIFFLLLQLVPESTMALLTGVVALLPVMTATSYTENTIVQASSISGADEVEVRVGVPRF